MRMKSPPSQGSPFEATDDPLARFAGPAETVAASIPRALRAAIRAKVGKRECSRKQHAFSYQQRCVNKSFQVP